MSTKSGKEKVTVGKPINFRGLVYGPTNEQGVVYLFSLIAEDLNIRAESIQQGYPDCTAIRYAGRKKWERINIEFEYLSSGFDHDPAKCDLLVCWEDDLSPQEKERLQGLEILELSSSINTPEIPNRELKDPDEPLIRKEEEYDLDYHFVRAKSTDSTKQLFKKVDEAILGFNKSVWRKFAKTAITYYSPERTFVFLRLRKKGLRSTVFTNQQQIEGVSNIKEHENWGIIDVKDEAGSKTMINAAKKSLELMREAIEKGLNTGWYALTKRYGRP